MNGRLTYTEYKGCKNILAIDLHNNYVVIAIKSWNPDEHNYTVELRIKEINVEKWDLIEKAERLIFKANSKTINSAILKQVATYLKEGFFTYYINRYKYEMSCLDRGIELYEKERLSRLDAS